MKTQGLCRAAVPAVLVLLRCDKASTWRSPDPGARAGRGLQPLGGLYSAGEASFRLCPAGSSQGFPPCFLGGPGGCSSLCLPEDRQPTNPSENMPRERVKGKSPGTCLDRLCGFLFTPWELKNV